MIQTKIYINENGVEQPHLIETYSDQDFKIKQVETGNIYDRAVDLKPCKYTYEETSEKIEIEETQEVDND